MELHKNSNAPKILKLYPRLLNNIIFSKSKRGQTPMLISHTMQEPLFMSPPWKGQETHCFSPASVCLSVLPSVCLSVTKSCPLYNLITVRDLSTELHMPHNQESFLCYEKSKIQRQPNIFCCRITFISPRNSQINTIFTITIKCSQVTIRYGKRSKFVPKAGNLAPLDYCTCTFKLSPLYTDVYSVWDGALYRHVSIIHSLFFF